MSKSDAAVPVTELDRWNATIVTREQADAAAGITDPATVNARAAYEAAANRRKS